jgi:hypothetical protein
MMSIFNALGLAAVLCCWKSPDDLAWVESRIQELQPKASEKKFDEIGWVLEVREAERLAKAQNRAVFIFTHDGRMASGRC